jgi:hypothetical protein
MWPQRWSGAEVRSPAVMMYIWSNTFNQVDICNTTTSVVVRQQRMVIVRIVATGWRRR